MDGMRALVGWGFFELCNSLIITLYILFPCSFLFAFVCSNNISLMLWSNIGNVGFIWKLSVSLLSSSCPGSDRHGFLDAFLFELSSILWAFAWLISHHILSLGGSPLAPVRGTRPALLAVRCNHRINHRDTEWLGLEGTLKDQLVPTSCPWKDTFH